MSSRSPRPCWSRWGSAASPVPTRTGCSTSAVPEEIPAVARIGGIDVLRTNGSAALPGVRVPDADVLLLTVGATAALGLEVADRLEAQGLRVTVLDPRWVKPLSPALAELAVG